MRAVHRQEDLESEARAAMREALNAFGDDRIYVERLLTGSRHIEIQVLVTSMAKPYTSAKENAAFKEDIRRYSRNLQALH